MNNHLNFNLVSRPSEVFTSFRGPMLSFTIVKSINRETGLLRRWTVFSQGKRSTLVTYLFGKLFWDELNTTEAKIFWHLSELTSSSPIYLCMKALAFGIDKKVVRKRAIILRNLTGFNFPTRQHYLTLKGRVNFFLYEETVSLRRVPKFSGYTKHHRDKGSLGPEKEEILSEILEPDVNISDEIHWNFLSVGNISLFGGEYSLPDESQKARNGPIRNKNINKP